MLNPNELDFEPGIFVKIRLQYSIVVLALLACVHQAAAQGTPVFPIATNPAVREVDDGIAFDGTNYLVTLLVGTTNLNAQLVSADGALLGSQISLAVGGGSSSELAATRPVFAGTNYLVAWSDTSITTGVDIFGQFISRSGAKVGPAFDLLQSRGAHGPQIARALATDTTNFLAVWQDASNGDCYGQWVTASGTLSGSEFLISGQSGNGNSIAATFGRTNYLVAWQSDNGVAAQTQAYGAVVPVNGSPGSPVQIGQTVSADQKTADGISVAFDGTNFLVVWMWNPGPQTSGTVTNWQVYGRLVSHGGGLLGNELVLTSGRNQVLPCLAFDGANFLLTYGYDSNTTNSDSTIDCQFLNRSGNPAGPVFAPFAPQGTNGPLLAVNGLLFDGSRFVMAASFGSVAGNSSEVFGAFLPNSSAPPTLSPIGPLVGTHFPLMLAGTPGISYAIQASTNLASPDWLGLATNSPTNGTFTFTDPGATNTRRFYRAAKQ